MLPTFNLYFCKNTSACEFAHRPLRRIGVCVSCAPQVRASWVSRNIHLFFFMPKSRARVCACEKERARASARERTHMHTRSKNTCTQVLKTHAHTFEKQMNTRSENTYIRTYVHASWNAQNVHMPRNSCVYLCVYLCVYTAHILTKNAKEPGVYVCVRSRQSSKKIVHADLHTI